MHTNKQYLNKGTQDEMCLAFFMAYPKPELSDCITWHREDALYSWFGVAIDKGYTTDEPQWIADDNDVKECGDLWYNEYWRNSNYLQRYEWCGSIYRESLKGSNYPDDFLMDAWLESDFEIYTDDSNSCRSSYIPSTTSTDISWEDLCNSTTTEVPDSANNVFSFFSACITIFVYIQYM